jgi:DNA-binding NarL/FixJ family response regulator
MTVPRIRVLLADDHEGVRCAARALLEPEFDVVGEVPDGAAVLRVHEDLEPDVMVLDISMPELDGFEVARSLSRAGIRSRIVFLTLHEDDVFRDEARAVGAVGYVSKARMRGELRPAVREAAAGLRGA